MLKALGPVADRGEIAADWAQFKQDPTRVGFKGQSQGWPERGSGSSTETRGYFHIPFHAAVTPPRKTFPSDVGAGEFSGEAEGSRTWTCLFSPFGRNLLDQSGAGKVPLESKIYTVLVSRYSSVSTRTCTCLSPRTLRHPRGAGGVENTPSLPVVMAVCCERRLELERSGSRIRTFATARYHHTAAEHGKDRPASRSPTFPTDTPLFLVLGHSPLDPWEPSRILVPGRLVRWALERPRFLLCKVFSPPRPPARIMYVSFDGTRSTLRVGLSP